MGNGDGQETVGTALAEQAGTPTAGELAQDQAKFLAIAERLKLAVKAVDALICAAVGTRCNPGDFVRHASKDGSRESFYLQATGARKVRTFFGIYFRERSITVEPLGTDEQTGIDHYNYEVTGVAGSQVLDRMMGTDTMGGTQIDVFGSRSSRDGFFAKGDREPDQNDVKKAALSNWEARAVVGLLGLQNLSRDDLKKYGIAVERVLGVEHQTGAEGGGNTSLISEGQGKRLYAITKGAKVSDADAKALLSAYGFDHSSRITRDRYDEIVTVVQGGPEKVKARLAELADEQRKPAANGDGGADNVPFGD